MPLHAVAIGGSRTGDVGEYLTADADLALSVCSFIKDLPFYPSPKTRMRPDFSSLVSLLYSISDKLQGGKVSDNDCNLPEKRVN